MQDSLTKADADVSAKRTQSEHFQVSLEQTNQKCNDLTNQLKQRSSEIEELKRSLEETKEDAKKQLQEKVGIYCMNADMNQAAPFQIVIEVVCQFITLSCDKTITTTYNDIVLMNNPNSSLFVPR